MTTKKVHKLKTEEEARFWDKEIDNVKSMLDRCKKGSRRWKRLKTQRRGKYTYEADERYSTQTCSNCGRRRKLNPSIRTYKCPNCGYGAGQG